MENSFQTSFIPKKPVTTNIVARGPSTNLFTVLTIILLIVMGLASGGLFFYKNYLVQQKEVLSDTLLKARDSFEKSTIDELELYSKRVNAAKEVLNGHLVLSPLFTLLGNLTIPEVQYTKFEHTTNGKEFTVKMSGVAADYRSIALQADSFNSAKGRSFKNVVFSNLTKNKNNSVGFDLEFNVDPSLLSYEKNILAQKTDVPSTPVIQTQTPTLDTNTPTTTDQNQNTTTNTTSTPPINTNNNQAQ